MKIYNYLKFVEQPISSKLFFLCLEWKFLFLAIVFMFLIPSQKVFSQIVSEEVAVEVAQNWLNYKESVNKLLPILAATIEGESSTLAYVYQLQPKGYLVVSAHKELFPIVAYSFSSFYFVGDGCPLDEMLAFDLARLLESKHSIPARVLQENKNLWEALEGKAGFHKGPLLQQWPEPGTTTSGGWVETNYSQSTPYNDCCPMDLVSNHRSVAGCPAVAMAMIVDFTNTTNETQFNVTDEYFHNYSGNSYWVDQDYLTFDFPSFVELSVHFNSISAKYSVNEALNDKEKAALVFGCGVAAKQVYGSAGSGTFGIDQAYDAYQRFGFEQANLLYDTDTSFYTQIQQNIMLGMPVHLALLQDGGSGGHNIVADGYNTDDYYHLNFGWGGASNGWYHIPQGIPYSLTIVEGAVSDIGAKQVGLELDEKSDLISFNICPNPANDHVNIGISTNEAISITVDLFSMSGLLRRQLYNGIANAGEQTICLSESPSAGVYLVVLRTQSSYVVRKLVVK